MATTDNNDLKFVRTTPVREGKHQVGQRILGVRDDSILARLGIKNGDILTQIDTYAINDPTQMLEAYAAFGKQSDHTIEVSRGGKKVKITYHME